MKLNARQINNESGFVLVVSLLMLLILVVIGIAALNMSVLDIKIAGNESISTATFYEADGGAEFATRLIEENLSCPEGFIANFDQNIDGTIDSAKLPNAYVSNVVFAQPTAVANLPSTILDQGTTSLQAMFASVAPNPVYVDASTLNTSLVIPNTKMIIEGVQTSSPGSGLAVNEGYSGLGYSSAAGGTQINYEVYAENQGEANSEAIIAVRWRHKIGMEGECNF